MPRLESSGCLRSRDQHLVGHLGFVQCHLPGESKLGFHFLGGLNGTLAGGHRSVAWIALGLAADHCLALLAL